MFDPLFCYAVLSFPFQFCNHLDEEEGESWPRGYKTFFMLNSVEHKIYLAHKC